MSSGMQRVGPVKRLMRGRFAFQCGMSLWPPFLFSGIRILSVSDDEQTVRVGLAKSPLTTNYVGTQFGGSIFAMTDPFWMLLIQRAIGHDHVIWDKAGEIEFIRPARTRLVAEFTLTDEIIAELVTEAADGSKVLRWFSTDIIDTEGVVVARVRKQIYVRRKREQSQAPLAPGVLQHEPPATALT